MNDGKGKIEGEKTATISINSTDIVTTMDIVEIIITDVATSSTTPTTGTMIENMVVVVEVLVLVAVEGVQVVLGEGVQVIEEELMSIVEMKEDTRVIVIAVVTVMPITIAVTGIRSEAVVVVVVVRIEGSRTVL
jgi:hypothetical protein